MKVKCIEKPKKNFPFTLRQEYEVIKIIDLDGFNKGYIIVDDNGNSDDWYHESWFEVIEEYDMVNPNHYKQGDKETWEQMLEIWGKDAFIKHCEITAFKYIQRLGKKPNNSIEQDLEKARWYLNKAYDLKNN
jgi:hypothetical protein